MGAGKIVGQGSCLPISFLGGGKQECLPYNDWDDMEVVAGRRRGQTTDNR